VIFGLFAQVGSGAGAICDHRLALLYAGTLFLPAALVSWFWLPHSGELQVSTAAVVNPPLAVSEQ
jgi:hypothetical protein